MSVLVVGWVLALLAAFGASFHYEARTDLRLTRLERDAAISRSLARSGVALVAAVLRETGANEWDAPGEGWDQNPSFRKVDLESGFFSVGYAVERSGAVRTVYGCRDEGRRIPWHQLDAPTLQRLPGISAATASSIERHRSRGGLPQDPSFRDIPDLDERSRRTLAEYLTVYPTAGVNINTAPEEVLAALDIPEKAVRQIVGRRNGPDGLPATEDDRPFTSLLVPSGGLQDCNLDSREAAVISLLARKEHLIASSDVFRITARGWVEGVAAFCEIEAVIRRDASGDVTFLDWSEAWTG